MERLKITLNSDPLTFITIECADPPRARQVARWILNAQMKGSIPLREPSGKEDEAVGTKLFRPKKSAEKAAKISAARRRL